MRATSPTQCAAFELGAAPPVEQFRDGVWSALAQTQTEMHHLDLVRSPGTAAFLEPASLTGVDA